MIQAVLGAIFDLLHWVFTVLEIFERRPGQSLGAWLRRTMLWLLLWVGLGVGLLVAVFWAAPTQPGLGTARVILLLVSLLTLFMALVMGTFAVVRELWEGLFDSFTKRKRRPPADRDRNRQPPQS